MEDQDQLDRLIDVITEKTGQDREGIERVVNGITQIVGATNRIVGATRFAGRWMARGWKGSKPLVERFRRFLAERTIDPQWMIYMSKNRENNKEGQVRWKIHAVKRIQSHGKSTPSRRVSREKPHSSRVKRGTNPWLAPALRTMKPLRKSTME